MGVGVGAGTTTQFGEDLYAFSKSKGLYGGMALEGTVVAPKHDWNEAYLRTPGRSQGDRAHACGQPHRHRRPARVTDQVLKRTGSQPPQTSRSGRGWLEQAGFQARIAAEGAGRAADPIEPALEQRNRSRLRRLGLERTQPLLAHLYVTPRLPPLQPRRRARVDPALLEAQLVLDAARRPQLTVDVVCQGRLRGAAPVAGSRREARGRHPRRRSRPGQC